MEAFYRALQRHGTRRNMFPFFKGNTGGPSTGEATVDNMLLYSPVSLEARLRLSLFRLGPDSNVVVEVK